MGIRSRYAFLAGIAALSLVAAACSSSAKTSSPPASSAPAGAQSSSSSSSGGAVTIETKTGAMGTYLVNGAGMSLYMFASDTSSKSACTGQCLTYWPPVTGTATASGGANASMLGTITGTDGKMQVTYGGHPLYTFTEDTSPGDTKGQGSTNFGAKWWLVAPSGQIIQGSSAGGSSSSSSSSSSGGGGWS